ncbi:hypothetical protein [Paenibacillus sp. FSL H3-0333]|uniref:hypothetical protein n=1 Tax=Paenibacillus sp. FSL H3-0333 TaxID=2921373 RepID=UPI0030F4FB2F
MKRVFKCIIPLIIVVGLLSGCGYETQEYQNLIYKGSHLIDRSSGETPFTAMIFTTITGEEKVLYDDENQTSTSLIQEEHRYDVTVSVASRFYYGNAIVSIKESK